MDIEDRHNLTFEEAEGLVAMPGQLELGKLSKATSARLWQALHTELSTPQGRSPFYVSLRVLQIVTDEWVMRRHIYVDEVPNEISKLVRAHKPIFVGNNYAEILGLIQFHVRHRDVAEHFRDAVEDALIATHSAYRLIDGRTIAPVSSEHNAAAIAADLHEVKMVASASAHLDASAAALSTGDFAGSVRESIHAVDAVAKKLAPQARDVGPALTALEGAGYLHKGMKAGFSSLYGYASDEKGIRHALLDDPKPNVTEADALYMFGTCAAFCAYLVAKGREFELLR